MILPNEICDITNRVSTLLSQARTTSNRAQSESYISQALDISCDFLSRLSSDDFFLQYHRAVNAGDRDSLRVLSRTGDGSAIEVVSMDTSHFEGFLHREKQLLIASGLDSYIADMVISRISSTIGNMRRNPTPGADLERYIAQLRRHVCDRSETIIQALKTERPARGLVYGLGGIALVAVNIAADGLSPIGRGASAGMGGSLVKDGVQILLEAISAR